MKTPTCAELFGEELEEVQENLASWRHGHRVTQVFHRESDDTYWQATYLCSSDGETNELREGGARIIQVEPRQMTVTKYVKIQTVPVNQENNDGRR